MNNLERQSETPAVALVTGGGRRVGEVIVRTLAAAGYRVAIHANRSIEAARRLAEELSAGRETESPPPAMAVEAELRDPEAIGACVEQVVRQMGRIDALVNSAAIWNSRPLEQTTVEDLRAHFEINALGPFLFCQQVGAAMVGQAEGGAIVNIGDWAIERPYLNYAAYFLSKGSIPTLTRAMAVELATRNPRVRVNAVLPGPVSLPADLSPAEREEALAGTLVKREGSPANVADAVLFLLRNDFITGACLPVDGGRGIHP